MSPDPTFRLPANYKTSIKRRCKFVLTYLKGTIVLSVLAFLFVTTASYESRGALISSRCSFENFISYKLLRADIARNVTGFNPGYEYDRIVAVTKPGIEFDFLGPTYPHGLFDAASAAASGDFETLVRPAYFTDLPYNADALNTNPEPGTGGEFFAYNTNFGKEPDTTADLFNDNDDAAGPYYYYVASIGSTRLPESSVSSPHDKLSISSSSSDDDSADEAISEVGDSPLSTHSLFEALSISGTYPDNDVIEIELPPVLLGDKRIIIGAGWLLPSGIQIPLGAVTDNSEDESAYYLTVILRF